jgi:hypothetical protein
LIAGVFASFWEPKEIHSVFSSNEKPLNTFE